MAFLDDFENEYQGDFEDSGEGESSNYDSMAGYDDEMYGYTRQDDGGGEGDGGGYVSSGLGEGDTEEAWQKRMNLGNDNYNFRLQQMEKENEPVAKQAANYGGGGGGDNNKSSGGSSIAYQRPLKDMPTLGSYGAAPTYDEGKVRSLQQEKAATGISKLRGAVGEAITRSVSMDNPYLRKMLLKDTLSGFGEGMGSVMDTADTNARRAYDTEYKGKLTEYQDNINRTNTMFEAAMRDYLQNPYDMTIDPITGKKLKNGRVSSISEEGLSDKAKEAMGWA